MGSRYDLAIITGGSSGIGKSIIELLGKLEPESCIFNLSRRLPELFTNGNSFHHFKCDLASPEERAKAIELMKPRLRQIASPARILLVNNAGFGAYGPVDTRTARDHLDLIEVNVSALVDLTVSLLPEIKQGGGSIMNIASTTAFQPTPQFATYGACKGFVLNWTLALNEELRGSGARALAICPGPTATEFFERAGASSVIKGKNAAVHPDRVAEYALNALEKSRPFGVPGALNRLLTSASCLLPLGLRTRVAGKVISHFRTTIND